MKIKPCFTWVGMLFVFAVLPVLRADVLEMQNGDRYSGKVLSMYANIIVLNSEVLGRINVPRSKVASVTFGTNNLPAAVSAPAAAAQSGAVNIPNIPLPVSTNLPIVVTRTPAANTNLDLDLATAFRQLGADTNFIDQIRKQMFAGNPQGEAKFDEMVGGLLNGQMNLGDLRKQARASAEQLRELKRDLPDSGDSMDAYLQILDNFVKETANEPANATP